MNNVNDYFLLTRHRDNYHLLFDSPLSSVIDDLQIEFPLLYLHGLTETTLEKKYPVIKITISKSKNICSVYVVFDSEFGNYGVGIKGGYGLNNLIPKNSIEETKETIKEKFREQFKNW